MQAQRLTREEEADLARRIQVGDERALDLLLKRNRSLVYHIARRFKGPLPMEDRVQEGMAGLVHAARLFRPERGVRFGTYASWWIRQAITRAIANQSRNIRVPVYMHFRMRRLKQEAEHLGRKLGREPTLDELGHETGCPRDELSLFAKVGRLPVSLSAFRRRTYAGAFETGAEEGSSAAGSSPEDQVIEERLRGDVARSLGGLEPRERYMVGRRFGLFGSEASTLAELGKELGLSRERVRQIIKRALGKIREGDDAHWLRELYS